MKLSNELKNFSKFSNIKLRVEGNKLHAKIENAEVEFVIKTLKILLAKENPNMLIESEHIKTFAGKTSVTISFRTIPGDTNG